MPPAGSCPVEKCTYGLQRNKDLYFVAFVKVGNGMRKMSPFTPNSPYSLAPLDFWRRHYFVHDRHFRKIGSCDKYRGHWIFSPLNSDIQYVGQTPYEAVTSWFLA